MSANILQEYLVSLGFQVNNAAFNQFQNTMRQADQIVNVASTNMARSLTTAAGLMVTAIVGVTTATGSMLHELGKADLEYKKYALRMYLTNQSAKELKTTLDALGESIEDAAFIPELRAQFQALYAQGRQMEPPKEFAEQLKQIQAFSFEFKRMKLEVTFALQWIGYYLMKHLAGPFQEVYQALKNFNDYITENMHVWTEKVASAMATVVNVGRSLVWLFTRELPGGLKIFEVALAAFGVYLLTSPIGLFLVTLGAALLLLEDFYGYTHGWDSSKTLAPMWEWVMKFSQEAKESPALKMLKKDFTELKDKSIELVKALKDVYFKLGQIDALKNEGWGDFLKRWWQNMVQQTHYYLQAIGFVLEFWLALLTGNFEDFFKRKLVDLQNFVNGKKPGDPGYHGGGSPDAGKGGIDKRDNGAATPGFRGAGPSGTTSSKRGSNEFEAFVAALVNQESGGNYDAKNGRTGAAGKYQIMPENWPGWSVEAGLPPGSPMTPENQDFVARFKLKQYYDLYGARGAAIAWYAGPGAIGWSEAAKNRKQGPNGDEPSINEYADSVMRKAQIQQTTSNGDLSFGPSSSSGNSVVVATTNNINVEVPPGADAEGYALAIAKALEPYQGRATQITIARQIRDLQGVSA